MRFTFTRSGTVSASTETSKIWGDPGWASKAARPPVGKFSAANVTSSPVITRKERAGRVVPIGKVSAQSELKDVVTFPATMS